MRSHTDWLGGGQLKGDGGEGNLRRGRNEGTAAEGDWKEGGVRREERSELGEGRCHGIHAVAPHNYFLFFTSQK